MSNKENTSGKVLTGALIGAAAGFIGGVLYAPKSGKETREDLKNGTKKVIKVADKQLHIVHDELAGLVVKVEGQMHDLKESVKTEAYDKLSLAKKARDQAATVLTAVRNGDSNDEDLELAVKNATAAIDNLKKYLKK